MRMYCLIQNPVSFRCCLTKFDISSIASIRPSPVTAQAGCMNHLFFPRSSLRPSFSIICDVFIASENQRHWKSTEKACVSSTYEGDLVCQRLQQSVYLSYLVLKEFRVVLRALQSFDLDRCYQQQKLNHQSLDNSVARVFEFFLDRRPKIMIAN